MRNFVYLLLVGVVVYSIITVMIRAQERSRGPEQPSVRRTTRAAGRVAPDDNPDFLWRLEQQQRRADRDAKLSDPGDDGSDQDHPGTHGSTP
ncbi:MAG TPA: hypothetical protein VIK12_08485 [Pengzhenrongella sp.]